MRSALLLAAGSENEIKKLPRRSQRTVELVGWSVARGSVLRFPVGKQEEVSWNTAGRYIVIAGEATFLKVVEFTSCSSGAPSVAE